MRYNILYVTEGYRLVTSREGFEYSGGERVQEVFIPKKALKILLARVGPDLAPEVSTQLEGISLSRSAASPSLPCASPSPILTKAPPELAVGDIPSFTAVT